MTSLFLYLALAAVVLLGVAALVCRSRAARRTAELEAANRELEAFAYSVAHDLRAPLRAIDGFSKALMEDYYRDLDETAQDFLLRIRRADRRMEDIIESLLRLSRVTRKPLQKETVDLGAMMRDIMTVLQSKDPTRKADVRIGDNLTAKGDKNLLNIMLENLGENAWKFTSKTAETRIVFGRRPDARTFFIRDNGAGFDGADSDVLFTPFNRQHSAEEFDGTGIGLAIVQRVVKRHGGKIWAEGAVGKGAAFFFTL